MQYHLGDDEQKPGLPFIRLVNPTELDKAVDAMERRLRDRFGFIDFLSPKLWRMLGFDDGPLYDFLYRYMLIARDLNAPVTRANLNTYMVRYTSDNPKTNQEDLRDYFETLIELADKGLIPDAVYKPFGYTPTEPIDDISENIAKATAKGFNKVLVTGAVVAVVYLLGKEFIIKSGKGATKAVFSS